MNVRACDLRSCREHVVPVMSRRTEAFDGGVQSDHGASHVLASGIGVKTAVDLAALVQERCQPAWAGSGAGCREAPVLGVESKATERINGRLTKDESWASLGGKGEEAQVFLRAGGQAAPPPLSGSAQLSPDREVLFSQQQENGVSSGIGIERAGPDERLEQRGGYPALSDQVVFDAPELAGIREREL